ncbi:MAG: NAD-dependent epimerase/dehydratase family protein [Pseudomonadales bacterium]|nr:NAD-dependent epimerase/dehydratase family protein [Pseudomonadales bacterium]
MTTAAKQTMSSALVVFGGTGFVGTAVLAEALSQDKKLQIIVVNRTGEPPAWVVEEPVYQTNRLRFVSGDLLKPQTVREALSEIAQEYHIIACISCVGAITPWSNKQMIQTCGEANINAYTISKETGATKFAVITRDRSNMDDWWYPFPHIIPGYYLGKRMIEDCIEKDVDNAGNAICIRAGFVTGTRRTIPGLPTSLKLAIPMEPAYKIVERFCPVIAVQELAAAAVRFVLSDQKATAVLVTNNEIPDYFKGTEPAEQIM